LKETKEEVGKQKGRKLRRMNKEGERRENNKTIQQERGTHARNDGGKEKMFKTGKKCK
jgi:hypothetical protein